MGLQYPDDKDFGEILTKASEGGRQRYARKEILQRGLYGRALATHVLLQLVFVQLSRETCNNGTLLDLKRDVEAQQITFKCYDDPP